MKKNHHHFFLFLYVIVFNFYHLYSIFYRARFEFARFVIQSIIMKHRGGYYSSGRQGRYEKVVVPGSVVGSSLFFIIVVYPVLLLLLLESKNRISASALLDGFVKGKR